MRARSLMLAALILAAPAPAFASPDTEVQTAPPAAETSPQNPAVETSPQGPATGTDPAPVQSPAPTPAPAPQPVQDDAPATSTDPAPQTDTRPTTPQATSDTWWTITDPSARTPTDSTTTPRSGATPATGTPGEATPAAESSTGLAPQSSAIQPITSALVPGVAAGPALPQGSALAVKHYAAKDRVKPGTVTYVASPPRGKVTYGGVVNPTSDIALWGTGAALLLAVVAGALHTRRAVARRRTS